MSESKNKNVQDTSAGEGSENSSPRNNKKRERKPMVDKSAPKVDLEERVVAVNRVAKVVKGGRRFSFAALIVVGDKNGRVGYALGKAKEVPDAIRKAGQAAAKRMFTVSLDKGTIPHEIIGSYGAGKILFKPAGEGTGIKAAGACRSILELAGYKNVLTKSLRGNNPHNIVKATFDALKALKTSKEISTIRGIDIKNIRIK